MNSLSRIYSAPLQTWPTVWLSSDCCCVLHQPVASQVYLLQFTPARLTTLTLLIKVSATDTLYRGYRRPSNPVFPARDYLPVHHVRRNYLKFFGGRRTRPGWSFKFEPRPWARYAPLHMAPECVDHWATMHQRHNNAYNATDEPSRYHGPLKW